MEEEYQVIIKEFALQQLHQEYLFFLEKYSVNNAEKFRLGFFRQIEKILPLCWRHPECRFLPTKNQIYRNIIWKRYLIVYRMRKNIIEVLSLFHTSQLPGKLKKLRLLN